MDSNNELSQFIKDWLTNRVGDGLLPTLLGSTSLVGEGFLDSLGFLELSTAVEHQFGIELDYTEDDPEHFVTLDGYIQLCQRHIAAN